MSNLKYFLAAAVLCTVASCSQNKKPAAKVNLDDFKPGKYCYKAKFETDSAQLSIKIEEFGNVAGDMSLNLSKPGGTSELNTGSVTGTFKGDTLMGDFVFTSGNAKDTRYENPIALLHKGDTLILGAGRIMNYLGRSYFDPKTPIDFQKSKFRFVKTDCK